MRVSLELGITNNRIHGHGETLLVSLRLGHYLDVEAE